MWIMWISCLVNTHIFLSGFFNDGRNQHQETMSQTQLVLEKVPLTFLLKVIIVYYTFVLSNISEMG
jgi:hypothetical protein